MVLSWSFLFEVRFFDKKINPIIIKTKGGLNTAVHRQAPVHILVNLAISQKN